MLDILIGDPRTSRWPIGESPQGVGGQANGYHPQESERTNASTAYPLHCLQSIAQCGTPIAPDWQSPTCGRGAKCLIVPQPARVT
jgi:hypothetical protein